MVVKRIVRALQAGRLDMATRVYGSIGLQSKRKQKEPIPERTKMLRKLARWKAQGICITQEQYAEMLAEQNGVCAICMRAPKVRALAPDHDHKTKAVRGLLCWDCNYHIVRKGHHAWTLDRAARYLNSAAEGEQDNNMPDPQDDMYDRNSSEIARD